MLTTRSGSKKSMNLVLREFPTLHSSTERETRREMWLEGFQGSIFWRMLNLLLSGKLRCPMLEWWDSIQVQKLEEFTKYLIPGVMDSHSIPIVLGFANPRNLVVTRFYSIPYRQTDKMMVDTGVSDKQESESDSLQAEKEEINGLISGGWKSEDGGLSCGYSSVRGKRASMEDFYDVKTSKIDGKPINLFGIFDGHGGHRAAEYLKEHLFDNLMNHPLFITNTSKAICESYQKTDKEFLDSEKDTTRDDGSTASTAVLVGNHLFVANVGDSRTVISEAGRAIALSEDHKPNRSDERKRIEDAGGIVMWTGTWRVGGVLAMSSAFGNRMLKQYVVAEPEIQDREVDGEVELVVLASDGLWDVVPNEDAVSIAGAEETPEAAAKKLVKTAYERGSADNITCIVVKFHHNKPLPIAAIDPKNNQPALIVACTD